MRRRSDWGPDLPAKAPIEAETVQFLLVHHTAEPGSDYQPEDVEGMLRQIYNFHTGTEKNWPDIAYNFFVDKFGTIWEARTGSAERALQGSATGGNQGFSQLCCFLGDFESEVPPDAAVASMIALLAWLADRYDIDMTPGATTTFTSRGSNLWPAGEQVTTETISTHRQMSQTTCPGTACHELVVGRFQDMVSAQLPALTPTTSPPSTETSTTTTSTTSEQAPKPAAATTSLEPAEQARGGRSLDPPASDGGSKWPVALGATTAAAVAAGALAVGVRSKSQPAALAPTQAAEAGTVPSQPTPSVPDPSFVALAASAPAVWWPPTTAPGSAGSAAIDGLEVFWLAGAEYPAETRRRIETSMRGSVDKLGSGADVSLGPWFTQMLSTILPSVSHPTGGNLILGAATAGECLALSTGRTRVEVPGVTGSHRAQPGLPGIDRRSTLAHRWTNVDQGSWLVGWIGGPGTLSVDPGELAARVGQGPELVAGLLGTTEGYLSVYLG